MIKIHIILSCTMLKSDPKTGEEIRSPAYFKSNQEVIYEGTDLEEVYQEMTDKILESFANYQKNGSGWRFESVDKLELIISKNNLLKASSHIPTAKKIEIKKAVINPKNDDYQCFKWCITIAFNPVEKKNSERTSQSIRLERSEISCFIFRYRWV